MLLIAILKWFYLHGTVLVTVACYILVLAVLYINAYEKKCLELLTAEIRMKHLVHWRI